MKRNRIFFFIYLIFWLADALLVPYLGLYYEEQGLTGTQIGTISLAEALVTPVAAILIGLLLSSAKKPLPFIVAMPIGCGVAAAAMFVFGNYAGILLTTIAFYFFRTPYNSAVDRILISRLHDNPASYSVYRCGGSTGYGIGALIAGAVYAAHNCKPLFWLYIPVIVATALFTFTIKEKRGTGSPEGGPGDGSASAEADGTVAKHEKKSLKDIFCFDGFTLNGTTLLIYGSLLLLGLTSASGGKFMAIYIRQQGIDPSITGTMIAFAMIGEISIAFLFPLFAKKLSSIEKFGLGFLFYLIKSCALTYIASLPMWLVLFAQIFGGAAFILLWTAATTMIEDAYPPKTGFVAQTLKSIFYSSIGYGAGCMMLAKFYDNNTLALGYNILVFIAVACTLAYITLSIVQRCKK